MTAISLPRLKADSLASRALNGILKSPKATIASVCCILFVVIAVIGPWIAPQNPYDLMQISIMDAKLSPGSESMAGATYWLGTDGQGRDMLSAMIYGLRTSLAVGLVSGVVALGIGTSLGLVAAYYGGRVDTLIMRLVDLMLGFPTILVALMMLALIGQGLGKVMAALVLVQWALFARAVRGAALVEKGKEYVEAATCLGLGKGRILFGHLLPNCLPPLHRHRDVAGGERHLGGGDIELPWHRTAHHRAVPRPAHRQRLRSAHVRPILDQRLSGPSPRRSRLQHQYRRRSPARSAEPTAQALRTAR